LFRSAAVLAAAVAQLASPNDAYRAALSTMQALPVPAYVAYRTDLDPGDATISLTYLEDGHIKPRVVLGADAYPGTSFQVTYSSRNALAAIETDPGRRAFTNIALFDPTWNGVSLWLRRGLLATLERRGAATPEPSASAQPKIPTTIATVYAFDPNAYRVEDAGVAWCGDDPGRLLRMTALRDVSRHPLQRVVIDAVDGRVCQMRFAVTGSDGPARFDGYVELQFGALAGYYLITGGYLDVGVREDGERVGYAHVRFHYRDARALDSLPDARR
jgi:hypothetical protein